MLTQTSCFQPKNVSRTGLNKMFVVNNRVESKSCSERSSDPKCLKQIVAGNPKWFSKILASNPNCLKKSFASNPKWVAKQSLRSNPSCWKKSFAADSKFLKEVLLLNPKFSHKSLAVNPKCLVFLFAEWFASPGIRHWPQPTGEWATGEENQRRMKGIWVLQI